MIKNVIFDLGGVIITLSQREAVRRFAELGLPDAGQRLDPYTQGGIFGQLEQGLIDAETFRLELGRLAGREITAEQCRHAWLGYRADLPQRNLKTLQVLRKKGYRLILLSNTNPFMMSWAESGEFDGMGHSLHDYFDAVYMSYRLGVMKPDRRFFEKVIAQEGIAPEETIFVDDGPRNVAAAAELGLHTLCPQNGEDWTGRLLEMLGCGGAGGPGE